jgi:tRNA-dihydrouridine synthase
LIARIIEENGGAAIAVHGRTRAQGYGGEADWEAIGEIKQTVSIPVIANGDVRTVSDIHEIEKITACDGVMIGRAAIGNPWIFSYLDRQQVPKEKVHQMVLIHLERMLKFYGTERGLVLFRKHANQYLSPYRLSREQRYKLLTCEQPVEFIRTLESINL